MTFGGQMKRELFTSSQVCSALGTTQRKLKQHIDEGLVSDSPGQKRAPGIKRRFNRTNMFEIVLAKLMAKHGFTLEQIKIVFEVIRSKPRNLLKMNPEGSWRKKLLKKPIGGWREDKSTRSRVRLIVYDIEKSKRPVLVKFTALHRPPLRLPKHGGVRIVPIESAYKRVEAIA